VWRKADALRVTAIPLERRLPGASSNLPGRQDSDTYLGTRRLSTMRSTPSLFGFAPGGVCHAVCVAADAVRSYRTISPLPRLTLHEATRRGGLFSVALSLGSPPPDVIRHRMSMEPGLSSPATFRPLPERPSSRLTPEQWGAGGAASRAPAVGGNRCRQAAADKIGSRWQWGRLCCPSAGPVWYNP
jgi:hypothetical protein